MVLFVAYAFYYRNVFSTVIYHHMPRERRCLRHSGAQQSHLPAEFLSNRRPRHRGMAASNPLHRDASTSRQPSSHSLHAITASNTACPCDGLAEASRVVGPLAIAPQHAERVIRSHGRRRVLKEPVDVIDLGPEESLRGGDPSSCWADQHHHEETEIRAHFLVQGAPLMGSRRASSALRSPAACVPPRSRATDNTTDSSAGSFMFF